MGLGVGREWKRLWEWGEMEGLGMLGLEQLEMHYIQCHPGCIKSSPWGMAVPLLGMGKDEEIEGRCSSGSDVMTGRPVVILLISVSSCGGKMGLLASHNITQGLPSPESFLNASSCSSVAFPLTSGGHWFPYAGPIAVRTCGLMLPRTSRR
jgi:hypothetical protein